MPPKRTLEDVVSDSGGMILHKDLLSRWITYRYEFPIRASGVPPVTHVFSNKPENAEQLAWHCYTFDSPTHFQQWYFPPFMVRVSASQQTAANIIASALLERFAIADNAHFYLVHYTSIRRIELLASRHPLVQSQQPHKLEKSLTVPIKDEFGRAKKNHQSPYDIQLTLEASGAQMIVGVSVHKVSAGFLRV